MKNSKYHFDNAVSESTRRQVINLLDEWRFQDQVDQIYIAPLKGGANNVNLILAAGSGRWVLKLRAPNCELFGTDPRSSIQAQIDASNLGIAAGIVASHPSQFHFISEFITGETLRPETAREKNLYVDVVNTLHILHRGKSNCRNFSLFDDIRLFMQGVDKANLAYPDGLGEMLAAANAIEQDLENAPVPKGFCHNDLVPQNLIRSNNIIHLVDFDYAGNTWVAVDLACATSQFEMSDAEVESFLKAYDEHLDDGQRGRLKALKFCNNLREASWAIMAEPLMANSSTCHEVALV